MERRRKEDGKKVGTGGGGFKVVKKEQGVGGRACQAVSFEIRGKMLQNVGLLAYLNFFVNFSCSVGPAQDDTERSATRHERW